MARSARSFFSGSCGVMKTRSSRAPGPRSCGAVRARICDCGSRRTPPGTRAPAPRGEDTDCDGAFMASLGWARERRLALRLRSLKVNTALSELARGTRRSYGGPMPFLTAGGPFGHGTFPVFHPVFWRHNAVSPPSCVFPSPSDTRVPDLLNPLPCPIHRFEADVHHAVAQDGRPDPNCRKAGVIAHWTLGDGRSTTARGCSGPSVRNADSGC